MHWYFSVPWKERKGTHADPLPERGRHTWGIPDAFHAYRSSEESWSSRYQGNRAVWGSNVPRYQIKTSAGSFSTENQVAFEKGLTNRMAWTTACTYSRLRYQEMLCQERNALRSRRTLWKYVKSFKLLYTPENFVTFTLISFCEDGEFVEKTERNEGCFLDAMPVAIDLGLTAEKAPGG